jgi:riboflavin synthase
MYTGITRGTWPVVAMRATQAGADIVIDLGSELVRGLEVGASVAVDGVCLTVVRLDGTEVLFQASKETLERTTLGAQRVGGRVGIERSYRIGDEMGGHELSGHVMGVGQIVALQRPAPDQLEVVVSVPKEWMKYIFQKGFIAVDGSSLTVGTTDPAGTFELHLIPETLRLTNWGQRAVGDRVNIELDWRTVAIVESVERVLAERFAAAQSG